MKMLQSIALFSTEEFLRLKKSLINLMESFTDN